MKKETGITIVALVVTIVVMLILVGVSVTVSINGGLFNTTKESTYKTEVSQVKEALEEEIVQRKARRESVDNITIADLDISDKLKDKYKDKLVFNTKTGEILYDPEIITKADEMQWLEDINVYPTTVYFMISGATITGFSPKGYEAIEKGTLSFNIPTKTKDGTIITTIGAGAFNANTEGKEKCANVKNIIIPESVTTIGGWAFACCTELKNVEVLGKGNFSWTFQGCTNLETITFNQDQGISFSGGAFGGCTSLKYIKIPASVSWFGDHLFSGCTSLQYIEIPTDSTLTSINGWQAFAGCSQLSHIHLPISMTKEGATWNTRCGFIRNDGSFTKKVYLPITREEYPSHWEGTRLNLTDTNIIYKDDEGWHSAEECPNKR